MQRARATAERKSHEIVPQFTRVELEAVAGEWANVRTIAEQLLQRGPPQTYGDYRIQLAAAYVQLGDTARGRELAQRIAADLERELRRARDYVERTFKRRDR